MLVSELIKKLEEIKSKEGDIQVSIQYRDDGGEYYGEEEPMLKVREDEQFTISSWVEVGDNAVECHLEDFNGKRVVL